MASRNRILIMIGACLAVGAGFMSMWWLRSARDSPAGAQVSDAVSQSASAGADNAPDTRVLKFRTRLLADAGIRASTDSVRIGLAYVPPDEVAAYRAWLRGGREGAGPQNFEDLAAVTRWLNAPATVDADGGVTVGPVDLPAADRYVLQARADDGLRFYEASFGRDDVPAEVRPRVAAGLRVRARQGAGLLLRRAEGSQDAEWQSLMRREAPTLLEAYDERPLKIGSETLVAPLPPGPVDVIAVVDGVETERRRLILSAGRFSTLDLDPEASELGAAVSVDVALRLVDKSTGQRVEGASVVWSSPRGERIVRPDDTGTVRMPDVDPLQALQIDIRFPPPKSQTFLIATLPSWPERMPMSLELGKEPVSDGVIAKTIELEPLRWLVVETPGIEIPRQPRVDEPFPIFVLQRREGAVWRESQADYFQPVPEGIAVSLGKSGAVRVVAVMTPWSLRTSNVVEISALSTVTRYRTRVDATAGRRVTLRIMGSNGPMARTPVSVLSPLRGVPPKTLTTDGAGRLVLDHLTESSVIVEVPGFVQARVRVDAAEVSVVLQRDAG